MDHTEERIALLIALHDLSRANLHADLGVLAGRLGWGVGRVVRVLTALDDKGLADRPRCRLTMAGLAVSAALSGRVPCSAPKAVQPSSSVGSAGTAQSGDAAPEPSNARRGLNPAFRAA